MELDEIRTVWNSNVQDDGTLQINEDRLLSITRKSKSKLSEFRTENLTELAIYSVVMFYLGKFMQAYITEPKFFIAALVLFVLSGINVAFNIYSLDFYGRLSPSTAITDLQKRLYRIRLYMTWERYLMILLIPLYLLPFAIVVAKGVIGFDLYPLISTILWKIVVPWSVVGTAIVLLITWPEMKRLRKISEDLKEIQEFEEQ